MVRHAAVCCPSSAADLLRTLTRDRRPLVGFPTVWVTENVCRCYAGFGRWGNCKNSCRSCPDGADICSKTLENHVPEAPKSAENRSKTIRERPRSAPKRKKAQESAPRASVHVPAVLSGRGGSNFRMRTTSSKVTWLISRSLVPS